MIGYMCGYLRYYYPCEFITAYLNNANNEDDIKSGTELINTLGIKLSDIKFRHSQAEYSCDPDNKIIYKGLTSIKYLSEQMSEDLYELRDNQYESFIDLLNDINNTSCDSRQLDILIKLNFFSEFGDIHTLLITTDLYNKLYNKKQLKKDKLKEFDIPEYLAEKHCEKATEKMYKFTDTMPLIKDLISKLDIPKTTIFDKLRYQNEYLGYLSEKIPSLSDEYFYVVSYEKNWVELYQLNDGSQLKIKIRKKTWNKNQFNPGEIIKVVKIAPEGKFYKDGDNWRQSTTEFEDILQEYVKCKVEN